MQASDNSWGETMDYLGLFCLGVFAGAITTLGLRRISGLTDWRQALVVTLPVLMSGAAMVLVDRFRYSPAVSAFPLGLAVSLLWATISVALDGLKSSEIGAKAVGWAHVAAAVGLTVASALMVIVPATGQVLAEAATPREVRSKELREAQTRANWGPSSRTAVAAAEKSAAASAPGSVASAPMSAQHASWPSAAASR